jgi:hypothetical protein
MDITIGDEIVEFLDKSDQRGYKFAVVPDDLYMRCSDEVTRREQFLAGMQILPEGGIVPGRDVSFRGTILLTKSMMNERLDKYARIVKVLG